ncbi:MAG TPA: DUF3341 domain-containing protein [Rhizomicrobium sp.]|jgi:hypothetical protein
MSEYLLVEFDSPHEALAGARQARDGGHAAQDVLSHMPIEGISDCLGRPLKPPIGWAMFIAGAIGAAIGYFMQWYSAVIDYPIISGNRPLDSWPAFLLVPYETTILSAAIFGFLSWMVMNGLPRLHHPLFYAAITERAVQDRYLLVFPRDATLREWIADNLHPRQLHEVRE